MSPQSVGLKSSMYSETMGVSVVLLWNVLSDRHLRQSPSMSRVKTAHAQGCSLVDMLDFGRCGSPGLLKGQSAKFRVVFFLNDVML